MTAAPMSPSRRACRASRPSRRRRALAVCCAELGLLAALVGLTETLTPRVRQAVPHSAAACAIALGVLAAVGYCVLTAVLLRARGQRRSPPAENTLAVALRRAGPALIAAAIVLVPYAIARNRGWVVLTFILAAFGCLLDWLWYRKASRQPPTPDNPAEAPSGPRAEKIDHLREFARGQGLEDVNILVAARDDGHAAAAYLPTRPQPTFLLTGELLDLLSPAELRAAFAHEIAHHQLRHSPKAALASILRKLLAVMAVAIILAAAGPGSPTGWEAVRLGPVVLLTWYLVFLGLRPPALAYLRHQEARAHRRALEIAGDAEAFVSGLRKIAAANDADEPAWWDKWLFLPRASLSEAVAIAERYAAGHGAAPPDEPPGESNETSLEDPDAAADPDP